jgi:spore coat protein CotH
MFYNQKTIDEIHLQLEPEAYQKMLENPFAREFVTGRFSWNQKTIGNVGMRLKGNLQINFNIVNGARKYSYKIDFNYYQSNQVFCGYKKTNLHNIVNDPSFLREHIAYSVFYDAGVIIPKISFANVYINGEHHGLYNHVEQVDSTFLTDRFGSARGNLYKPEGFHLLFLGSDPANYPWEVIGLQNNLEKPDHSRLIQFITILNHSQADDFKEQIQAIFAVPEFLKFLAINTFILNLDSYDPIGHNYYLYDNPVSGKFHFIPWDMTEAFGNFACREQEAMFAFDIHRPLCSAEGDARPLITNLLAVPEFKRMYLDFMRDLTEHGVLAEDALIQRLQDTHDFIRQAVFNDNLKFYSFDDFLTNLWEDVANRAQATAAPPQIYGLIKTVRARSENVRRQLNE